MATTTAQRDRWSPEQRDRYNAMSRESSRRSQYKAQHAYSKAHPEQRAAVSAVKWALKTGKLVKEPCLFCESPTVEAHHHSYAWDDRLNVTWLCRRHHRRAHRRSP
jgi:translation elongation factor EF-G